MKTIITAMEFQEIAEASMSYLYDNNLLEDFLEDRGIDLSDDKRKYFIPDDYEK